jgi:hypothetical protein
MRARRTKADSTDSPTAASSGVDAQHRPWSEGFHTPGPWTVETQPSDSGGSYITGHITSPRHTYAGNRVSRRDSITDPNTMTRNDAYLIAAAPDMLAALKAVCDWLLGTPGRDPPGEWAHPLFKKSYELATAAIAKAEGNTEKA